MDISEENEKLFKLFKWKGVKLLFCLFKKHDTKKGFAPLVLNIKM